LLLYRVSEALRLSQRDEEAAGMYDLAIDIRPDLKGPRVGRALSLIRSGEHQRAVECLEDDILATKACGVTFATSMLERVIEEQARGDADLQE